MLWEFDNRRLNNCESGRANDPHVDKCVASQWRDTFAQPWRHRCATVAQRRRRERRVTKVSPNALCLTDWTRRFFFSNGFSNLSGVVTFYPALVWLNLHYMWSSCGANRGATVTTARMQRGSNVTPHCRQREPSIGLFRRCLSIFGRVLHLK